LDISRINAQNVYPVNAYAGNGARYRPLVGKRSITEASAFWVRLIEAWGDRQLPVSQNGVAVKLGMSQGSTRRWYTGEGLPETETLMRLAELGHVTVHWLLTGEFPKAPVKPGTKLYRFLELWEDLETDGRDAVLRNAEAEAALQTRTGASQTPAKSSRRNAA
jgi:transcriptional regulator with XRE-family HTH domain